MSWFSGKKFRRVRCENVDEFLNSKNTAEQIIQMLKNSPPIVSFLRLDETTFRLTVEAEDKHRYCTFKIGEEQDIERLDGSKIKMMSHLESDNVLKQTLIMPDGKIATFVREFSETETKMTVQLDNSGVKAIIYYEVVE